MFTKIKIIGDKFRRYYRQYKDNYTEMIGKGKMVKKT